VGARGLRQRTAAEPVGEQREGSNRRRADVGDVGVHARAGERGEGSLVAAPLEAGHVVALEVDPEATGIVVLIEVGEVAVIHVDRSHRGHPIRGAGDGAVVARALGLGHLAPGRDDHDRCK
jgi:hypothetical protein